MSLGLKLIELPQLRRTRKAVKEAIVRGTNIFGIAPPGSGKTTILTTIASEMRWPVPLATVLTNHRRLYRFDRKLAQEAFVRLGLFADSPTWEQDRWLGGKFRDLELEPRKSGLAIVHDWDPYRREPHLWVQREEFLLWVRQYVSENKVAPVDEVRVSLELGIVPEGMPPHAIYLRGQILTTPGVIAWDIHQECYGVRPPHAMADRLNRVHNALRDLPILLMGDEVDQLSLPCLEFLRDLHDLTGTPLLLFGTDRFLHRLEYNDSLGALATRGLTLRLSPPTLQDLQGALPDLPGNVVMRAWARSGGNLRLLSILVGELERAIAGPPRRQPTPRLVDNIAKLLPRARPITGLEPEELPSAAPEESAATSTSTEAADRRRRAATGK